MNRESIAKSAVDTMIRLLYPQRCPVCDEPVKMHSRKESELICEECRDKLVYVKEPFCLQCGKPIPDEESEYCNDCKKQKHLYRSGRALYEYDSVAGAIYRFKYHGRQEYSEFFGKEMAEKLGRFIREVSPDGLVPVPLSKARFNRRGYNQAGLLAKEIGKRLDIPVYDKLVKRIKDTIPQKELNSGERQNNLKKAFKITENDVKLSTIIIIDDIYTTGSTIDAVAKVLLQAGVQRIYYLALAVGAGI